MDFTGRGSQPAQPANTQFGGGAPGAPSSNKKVKSNKQRKLLRWGGGVLGLLVVALVVAVIVVIGFGGQKAEANYVDDSKLQAVFLQTGQVYFGDVTSMNSKYFVLSNIYYLQTSSTDGASSQQQSAQNTNVSLVKLGCELHAPFDQMVINRDQVTFWENLQDDGQVAKAVATFKKENPDGQKCADTNAAGAQQNGTVQSNTPTGGSSTTNNNSDDN